MKKWLCLLFVGVLLLCNTACSNAADTPSDHSAHVVQKSDIDEIQIFLNDPANNGFIQSDYSSPEHISLYRVFYDGGGVGTKGTTDWTEQEKQDVLVATGWDAYHNPPLKLKRDAVKIVVKEKLGISLSDVKVALNENFCYVEKYDAYYAMHGDTDYESIVITKVLYDDNGNYCVDYTVKDALIPTNGIVTLRKVDNGFQFISNKSTKQIKE